MELAVFSDCGALIKNFVGQNDACFRAFCICWKKMRFQHIYTAQSSTVELLQTTAAAFHIAKRFACGEHRKHSDKSREQFLKRIGGLYLMYIIYFKQPTEQYVKIQITMCAWKELTSFVSTLSLITPNIREVQYIFWKLWQAHAFRFTVISAHVGLEQLVDYDNLHCDDVTTQLNSRGKCEEPNDKLKEELENFSKTKEILPALITLEEGYNEMKEKLASASGISKHALPLSTIFSDVTESFQRIQNIIEAKGLHLKDSNKQGQSKKRSIKEKGYRVEHDSNKDNDFGDDLPKSSTTRNLRRMSARTIFSESLTSELAQELKSGSDIEYELNSDIDIEGTQCNANADNTNMNKSMDAILSQTLNELVNNTD